MRWPEIPYGLVLAECVIFCLAYGKIISSYDLNDICTSICITNIRVLIYLFVMQCPVLWSLNCVAIKSFSFFTDLNTLTFGSI